MFEASKIYKIHFEGKINRSKTSHTTTIGTSAPTSNPIDFIGSQNMTGSKKLSTIGLKKLSIVSLNVAAFDEIEEISIMIRSDILFFIC